MFISYKKFLGGLPGLGNPGSLSNGIPGLSDLLSVLPGIGGLDGLLSPLMKAQAQGVPNTNVLQLILYIIVALLEAIANLLNIDLILIPILGPLLTGLLESSGLGGLSVLPGLGLPQVQP